ncbi:hypothetical protein P3X46_001270 [Hevea brasiliensis]|uniref:Uncharacterized protein n=1 Tax=Hevea brasiliensis TaxID=3981 RepID=A0ABQ9NE04_HEVBR|nr:uncharacterized protein LOC110650290 [Hevea brasiliensis]XP_021660884.2 uncharacterized protein LOC110650290 [Hevea brasiliensis]XP_058004911.1 uncharacterized protein LOC110650290 [Hevea brasiliensis]KAJ9190033.1 hypothetical protein P3X46_001270 [Hevea brasiliensis]
MAILSPATTARSAQPPPQAFPKLNAKNYQSPSLIPINSQFQFLSLRSNSNSHPCRLHAALSPQPAPQSDPPPEKDPVRPRGIFGTLSRLQDRVQIFLAVLFWMSLFFWASAWDGRNNGGGRSNKGSRFRR